MNAARISRHPYWEIGQMDVVTAFLNPEVDGDIYMAMPDGIEAPAGGPWYDPNV